MVAILAGQFVITNIFGDMFGVEALTLKDWLLIIATTSPVLIIADLCRLLHNKKVA